MARRVGLTSQPRKAKKKMAKWLTLYHPTRRIITTILDSNKEKLAIYERGGWKVGPLPPAPLPDGLIELEELVAAGDLIGSSLPKKTKKAKKASDD